MPDELPCLPTGQIVDYIHTSTPDPHCQHDPEQDEPSPPPAPTLWGTTKLAPVSRTKSPRIAPPNRYPIPPPKLRITHTRILVLAGCPSLDEFYSFTEPHKTAKLH
jgi:hypothetical protein